MNDIEKARNILEIGHILGIVSRDVIEKARKAAIGEIREWKGKRYRKQSNGKWREVSEHGKTKEEHAQQAKLFHEEGVDLRNRGKSNDSRFKESEKHDEIASKLDTKEYDDSEIEISPIGELGTGAKVYFDSGGYRVNENTKSGNILLNVTDKDGNIAANVEFDTPEEAVSVAEDLYKVFPNGTPPALLVDKYIEQLRNKK